MTKLIQTRHGGGCCGIRHLSCFCNYTKDGTKEDFILKSVDQIVKEYLPDNPSMGVSNCTCSQCVAARAAVNDIPGYKKRQEEWITAVECVLAGGQYKIWKQPLENCGFKEVFSFRNSNSKNMCHVFYGTTNPVMIERKEATRVESAPQDTTISV